MNRIFFLIAFLLLISCNSKKSPDNWNKDKLYSSEELDNKSLEELRMIRNEIFARHGYKFKSQYLKNHFSLTNWYEPKYNNVDSLLSKTDKENIELILKLENQLRKGIIKFDLNKTKRYEELFDSVESYRKKFITNLLKTIENFKNRKADTTILTIGNIDDLGYIDTIKTNIFYLNDTVYVKSVWTRKGKVLWEEVIKNPYLWISEADEFQYDTREPWIPFTIGLYHAPPSLKMRKEYSGINEETALKMGLMWFERHNIDVSESNYFEYLNNFKGQILEHGDPEIRHELLIWYEPLEQFVLYYAP